MNKRRREDIPVEAVVPVESVPDPDKLAEKNVQEHAADPEELMSESEEGEEPRHDESLTAIAGETLRSGVFPERVEEKVPGQDDVLRAGDPDVDPLGNLFSGEELPGASDPTPDQNNVDEIGRAAGISEEDDDRASGAGLRTPAELLDERDVRRWELDPRSSGRPTEDTPVALPRRRASGGRR
ncbi:DUF6335 family protein [Nannocystis pusilla]|uniref:DUF6335 family protein n=1 Tax=Nannocystis pusilla TaxID=889268 RepID=A0ABS7U4Z7_9BACT|nr:DUF6335 family protein [Nannocystis pusilla]MBZ5715635.1 DUF6335 family protein [Nannocystis pusilla]